MRLQTERLREIAEDGFIEHGEAKAMAAELVASREVKPYGYLRDNGGQLQISIGPERPYDRSGEYATPWGAIYARPTAPASPVYWEMHYWNSGYNCWHDWERITAEQHAEMSAQHAADNDYEFRMLYDAPPAVPDAVDYSDLDATSKDREVIEAIAECKGWNACRAAMLAAAPEDGIDHNARHQAGKGDS